MDGRFQNVDERTRIDSITSARAMVPIDHDDDEDPDLLMIDSEGRLRLFVNLRLSRFAEVDRGLGTKAYVDVWPLDSDNDGWLDIFDDVKDYLFVALCDHDLCGYSLQILRQFVFASTLGVDVLTAPSFVGCLALLYPMDVEGADLDCQGAVEAFLGETLAQGDPFVDGVVDLLLSFQAKFTPQFSSSVALGDMLAAAQSA